MRGELVTTSLKGEYGKPRPALIIQAGLFSHLASKTLIPLTSDLMDLPLFRYTITPTKENNLKKTSQAMVDKIHTVPNDKISKPFGKVSSSQLIEIERLVAVFLGIAE